MVSLRFYVQNLFNMIRALRRIVLEKTALRDDVLGSLKLIFMKPVQTFLTLLMYLYHPFDNQMSSADANITGTNNSLSL